MVGLDHFGAEIQNVENEKWIKVPFPFLPFCDLNSFHEDTAVQNSQNVLHARYCHTAAGGNKFYKVWIHTAGSDEKDKRNTHAIGRCP